MLPAGDYRYEIKHKGEILVLEEGRLDGNTIVATRRSADGRNRHEVEAELDHDRRLHRVSLRYSSSLFTRKAAYQAVAGEFRGYVTALAGRNEIVVKLGLFGEADVAEFVIFRALILDHVRERRQQRWTGRVAVIDASTLVAASLKHDCKQLDGPGRSWSYEARMGEAEEIEIDEGGRILRRRDSRGLLSELVCL